MLEAQLSEAKKLRASLNSQDVGLNLEAKSNETQAGRWLGTNLECISQTEREIEQKELALKRVANQQYKWGDVISPRPGKLCAKVNLQVHTRMGSNCAKMRIYVSKGSDLIEVAMERINQEIVVKGGEFMVKGSETRERSIKVEIEEASSEFSERLKNSSVVMDAESIERYEAVVLLLVEQIAYQCLDSLVNVLRNELFSDECHDDVKKAVRNGVMNDMMIVVLMTNAENIEESILSMIKITGMECIRSFLTHMCSKYIQEKEENLMENEGCVIRKYMLEIAMISVYEKLQGKDLDCTPLIEERSDESTQEERKMMFVLNNRVKAEGEDVNIEAMDWFERTQQVGLGLIINTNDDREYNMNMMNKGERDKLE